MGEIAEVEELLAIYPTVFTNNLTKQPAKLPRLHLKVNESELKVPQNRRAAKIQSQLKNAEINNQVQNMLDLYLIQPLQAAEKSQVVLTKKPDGSWRFYIDYRALNDATESMGWPIPNIPQMLQRIGTKRPKYLDWKGPYRVVAKDKDDLNRYTAQNLATKKLEDFPVTRLKSFVVNKREDSVVADNADNHLQIVQKIL